MRVIPKHAGQVVIRKLVFAKAVLHAKGILLTIAHFFKTSWTFQPLYILPAYADRYWPGLLKKIEIKHKKFLYFKKNLFFAIYCN